MSHMMQNYHPSLSCYSSTSLTTLVSHWLHVLPSCSCLAHCIEAYRQQGYSQLARGLHKHSCTLFSAQNNVLAQAFTQMAPFLLMLAIQTLQSQGSSLNNLAPTSDPVTRPIMEVLVPNNPPCIAICAIAGGLWHRYDSQRVEDVERLVLHCV